MDELKNKTVYLCPRTGEKIEKPNHKHWSDEETERILRDMLVYAFWRNGLGHA